MSSTSSPVGRNIPRMNTPAGSDDRQHWDEVYGRRAVDEVSWFEPVPKHSLELVLTPAGTQQQILYTHFVRH
jgi:hypothetical protein